MLNGFGVELRLSVPKKGLEDMNPETVSEKLDEAGITHEVKKRTAKQRSSYWLWLTMLAKELNDSGIPLEDVVFKLPRRASKENLHELIGKAAITYLYPDITSSEDPNFTTVMQQEVYKWVDQLVSERTGVHVEWPSRFGDD